MTDYILIIGKLDTRQGIDGTDVVSLRVELWRRGYRDHERVVVEDTHEIHMAILRQQPSKRPSSNKTSTASPEAQPLRSAQRISAGWSQPPRRSIINTASSMHSNKWGITLASRASVHGSIWQNTVLDT
jgi:hypothetical protein